MTAVVADQREEELVRHVAEALGHFGPHAAAAVPALERYMTTDSDVKKAIEDALVEIRGKPGLLPRGPDLD
jgi:hypothetical protein